MTTALDRHRLVGRSPAFGTMTFGTGTGTGTGRGQDDGEDEARRQLDLRAMEQRG